MNSLAAILSTFTYLNDYRAFMKKKFSVLLIPTVFSVPHGLGVVRVHNMWEEFVLL